MVSIGCYSPDYSGDGGFTCNKNGTCPEGFTCVGAAGSKVCVADGTPVRDSGTPDQAVDATLGPSDASDKTLTCVIESDSAAVVADKNAKGTLGLAFDEPKKTLYASYITSDEMKIGTIHIISGALGEELKEIHHQPIQGAETSIAAKNGKWVVVFQGKKNELLGLRSTSKTTFQLSQKHTAAPHVLLAGPKEEEIVAVHQSETKSLLQGELLRFDFKTGKQVGAYHIKANGYASSGYQNMVVFDHTADPLVLAYGTIAAKTSEEPTLAALIIATLPLEKGPTSESATPLGTIDVNNTSVALAPGLHVAMARQDLGEDQLITYRAPNKTDGVIVPELKTTSKPRLAVSKGMVGILAINNLKQEAKLTVLDEKGETWTPPTVLPKPAVVAQMVATPGQHVNQVVFHVLYRGGDSGAQLFYQPILCTRK